MDKKKRNKLKSKVRREVDIELGIKPPMSAIHASKKVYTRKVKHKNSKKN